MKQSLHDLFGVLRVADARWVLLGLALSVLGQGAAQVAIVLRAHDSGVGPTGLAVVLVLLALPVVLLSGVAGALADRHDPRPVVVPAALVQLVAAVGLTLWDDLLLTGAWLVVLQTGFALANSAWVVALPRLVTEEQVAALVSTHHALRGIAVPVGAAAGGVLVQHVGGAAPFVLAAVTLAVLAVVGLRLRPSTEPETQTPGGGLLRAILPLDGLAALRRHRLLAVVAGFAPPFVIVLESVNAVEVFLIRDVLGGTSSQYGLSEAVAGAAAVVGALGVSLFRTTGSRARAVIAAFAVISLTQVAQGFAPAIVVYVALAGAVGFLLGGVNALVMVLMVTATDPDSRGRIVALVGGAARSSGILALGLGGVLGVLLGPRGTFLTVGLLGLCIAVAAVHSLRRVPVDEQPTHESLAS